MRLKTPRPPNAGPPWPVFAPAKPAYMPSMAITWAQRLKRVFNIDIETCRACGGAVPWCTTPIEAESSLGPDSRHPIISLSGIPSAVMVFRILHAILASTLCAANPLARIAEPTMAL